jgi:hypothetical protein
MSVVLKKYLNFTKRILQSYCESHSQIVQLIKNCFEQTSLKK